MWDPTADHLLFDETVWREITEKKIRGQILKRLII